MIFEVYHRPSQKFYKVYHIHDGIGPEFLVYKDYKFQYISAFECELYEYENE